MPNTLVHHFGSKEELVSEILNGVRDRLRAMWAGMQSDPDADPLLGVWEWTSSPRASALLPLLLRGLRGWRCVAPGTSSRSSRVWSPTGFRMRGPQSEQATLELALLRGLLLDLLTTGERDRVERALARFSTQRSV